MLGFIQSSPLLFTYSSCPKNESTTLCVYADFTKSSRSLKVGNFSRLSLNEKSGSLGISFGQVSASPGELNIILRITMFESTSFFKVFFISSETSSPLNSGSSGTYRVLTSSGNTPLRTFVFPSFSAANAEPANERQTMKVKSSAKLLFIKMPPVKIDFFFSDFGLPEDFESSAERSG